MKRLPYSRLVSVLPALAFLATAASAETGAYVRMIRPRKSEIALQTRVTKLVPATGSGPVVWLVGAIHVGEKGYYDQIQTLLDAQDLVLYEGVNRTKRDAFAKPAPKTKEKATYELLSDALGLKYQLAALSYDRAFFRNTDLTWNEITNLAQKRGKGSVKAIGDVSRLLSPNSPERGELTTAFSMIQSDPGMVEALRVLMIRGLSGSATGMIKLPILEDPVLIGARNEKVLTDFGALRKTENSASSVAVFYGAGHLPGLQKGLISRFGYKVAGSRWLTAMRADESKVSDGGRMLFGGGE